MKKRPGKQMPAGQPGKRNLFNFPEKHWGAARKTEDKYRIFPGIINQKV